ncbi:hypothetical protein [Sphingobacterium bambusae]|uniref:Uncharacterized protein n=1 Tax=Sphingobacterium bambusae TaxID=662858 RepID=A0ABW6B8U8_9SPHI|nr:hypothetical protein [Sphingobacterium bambusae]WPL48236.1 hypothetical protein SCB77_20010 [Sphingobacterium bambusae]
MSYHKIEDLVEETIVFIDKNVESIEEKRNFFFNLFIFQNLFDCSFTHFRQIDILIKNNFTYRIPIDELLNKQDLLNDQLASDSDWLPVKINGQEVGDVYFQSTDQHLYFDAGSEMWNALSAEKGLGDAPSVLSTKQLLHQILSLCFDHDTWLFARWYAVLVEDMLEDALLENSMPAWLEDKIMLDIRRMAIAIDIPALFKATKKQDRYFSYPTLTHFKQDEDISYAFEGRFLLELQTDVEGLQRQFQKQVRDRELAQAAKAKLPEKMLLLEQELHNYLRGWSYGGYILNGEDKTMIWYQDNVAHPNIADDGFYRKFVYVHFDMGMEALRAIYALQHGLILRWQHANPSLHPADFHMYRDIMPFLTEEQQRSRHFNAYGLLKYPLKDKDSALLKRIDFLKDCLKTAESSYFNLLTNEFPSHFFKRDLDELLYTMENGVDDTGIIPEDIVIHSSISAKQLFAFHQAEMGNNTLLNELFPDQTEPVMPKLRSALSFRKVDNEEVFLNEAVQDNI